MPFLASRFGYLLAAVYLAIAGRMVWTELRETGGGWINLRGMGTTLLTAPSQATFGLLFGFIGVKPVNFNEPGFSGYAQLIFHLLFSAFVVYLVGYGLEWSVRRLFVGKSG